VAWALRDVHHVHFAWLPQPLLAMVLVAPIAGFRPRLAYLCSWGAHIPGEPAAHASVGPKAALLTS